ncbi:MAG: aminotransferase class III-fold pyridoxal phosphate-dependent enzyme [Acidobacteria bacterium]|nr:aminotransferase class III-fold pyridoxal phosphate-dependent enzyme [Acidobacteriota bacterium]
MGQKQDELLQRADSVPELKRCAQHGPVALKAQGSKIYDIDNHGYVDYTGGAGAAVVGYANQFILDSVKKVLAAGVPDGLHVPQEIDLAEALSQLIPWAKTWFFVRNHDEALRISLDWVRRGTGRPFFVVLDGGARWAMEDTSERSGNDRRVPPMREVPGWNLEKIEAILTAGASKIAAVVIDPLMTRFGVIPPPRRALDEIARVCRRNGIVVIFDELVSGFRIHRGGAAALFGIKPDIAVYGAALGAGFPIGAMAFRKGFEPKNIEQNGGLPAPHPVSVAAADAVLSILKNDAIYDRLEERTAQLAEGILQLAERFGRPMTINRLGSVFSISMGPSPVTDRASFQATDSAAYIRFAGALLDEGVLLPARPSGTAFVSHAHSGKDIDDTLEACERVLMRLHEEDLP